MPIDRTPFVVPTPVEELPRIDSGLWTLTLWEKITLLIDDIGNKAKFGATLIAPLFSLLIGLKMSNSQKIAASIVGLVVAVLAHFAIELPAPLVGALDVIVALLIGWLIPAPQPKQ